MEDYREQARRRYLEARQKQDEILQEETKKKMEEEMRRKELEEVHSYIYVKFEEWDSLVENYEEYTLQILHDIVNDDFISLLVKYDRLDELQERITRLVHLLNEQSELKNEEKKRESGEIREIYKIMKDMIERANVDIPIEMMDTSGDEDFAKKLEIQEYSEPDYFQHFQHFQQYEEKDEKVEPEDEDENIKEENKQKNENEDLPIVSFSSKKEGIRLVDMKKIAKEAGIASIYKMSKHDLGILLESKGLVKIVY